MDAGNGLGRFGAAVLGGVVFALVGHWLLHSFRMLGVVTKGFYRRSRPAPLPAGSGKINLQAVLMGVAFAVLLMVFPLTRLLWTVCFVVLFASAASGLAAFALFWIGRLTGRLHISWRDLLKGSKY